MTSLGPMRKEMLPPLPSTNLHRIHSFLPTLQISFLIASASGREKQGRIGASRARQRAGPGTVHGNRSGPAVASACPFDSSPRRLSPCGLRAPVRHDFNIPLQQEVAGRGGHDTACASNDAAGTCCIRRSCTSRMVTTLRLEISTLFFSLRVTFYTSNLVQTYCG